VSNVLGGRYALLDVLGTGGMATVWRARDEVLGREVAVKVLNPQHAADAAFRTRFEREARHVASLSHPRLVTVFDSGVDETTPFIVMELVAGRTLRQVLDEAGSLPADDAIAIAVGVCEALDAAHAAGLVHRDIKPANIALSGGEVKVLDFGIARLEGPGGGTRTQAVLGTAAYLSPEQALGLPVGPQADLYALGCVLFEMLTGAPPFTADSEVGVAYRQVHDDPGPPSARRPGLPAQLDWITTRLLAKHPADRPPGAAAARAGLLAARTPGRTAVLPGRPGQTAPGQPDDAAPDQPHHRRRWPTLAELMLSAALTASVAALVAVLLAGTGSAAPRAGSSAGPTAASHRSDAGHHASQPKHSGGGSGQRPGRLPPAAAAAGAFVSDLAAGVATGQVSQQAGQNLFNQLQQLLFRPRGQSAQQVQQRYDQLVQVYDQYQANGQVTGHAAAALSHALDALRTAVGAR
jgi:eukaryotic-like serine/threonine-protein kinase